MAPKIHDVGWNCGILALTRVNADIKPAKLKDILKKATTGVQNEHYDWGAGTYTESGVKMVGGYILASTTQDEKHAARTLRSSGFRALTRFKNPNSDNYVTLWGAPTNKK